MKKIFTLFVLLLFIFSTSLQITNGMGGSISINYSNYNGDQKLQISGKIDGRIDSILEKKFNNDYYRKFLFLKKIFYKVDSINKKSKKIKTKKLFNELGAYLILKSDYIYKLSNLTKKEQSKLKESFKENIKNKGKTFNDISKNILKDTGIKITAKNNNFDNLSKEDFTNKILDMISNIEIKKYKKFGEIIKENASVIDINNFKKLIDILPSKLLMEDEYGNIIKGKIACYKEFCKANDKLISMVNKRLIEYRNFNKNNLDNLKIIGLGELSDILNEEELLKFLSTIKNIGTIGKGATYKIEEFKNRNGDILGYGYTFGTEQYNFTKNPNKYILNYTNETLGMGLKSRVIRLAIFINKKGQLEYYLLPPLESYMYLGYKKYYNNKKTWYYLAINIKDKTIRFFTTGEYYSSKNYNINIKIKDGTILSSKDGLISYSNDDFKRLLNTEIINININGKDEKIKVQYLKDLLK